MRRAAALSVSLAVAAPLALPAAPASAGGGLPVDVSFPETLVAGRDRPYVKIVAREDLRGLRVTVARAPRFRRVIRVGFVGAGAVRRVSWSDRPGSHAYRVTLAARAGGRARRQTFEATIDLLPPIAIALSTADVDLAGRRLAFRLNHPAERAEVVVRDARGEVVARGAASYDGAAPGSRLAITWGRPSATPARLDLKAWGTTGYWASVAVTSWSLVIPHDDVVFETDRWEIRPSERPKLDRALARIREALRRKGGGLPASLYVAGFTDTVGSRDHNRTLSLRRAEAIARYFARRGVGIPVLYRGYGEEALAVATPDETPEARNRRAVYVVASHPPVIARRVTWGRWHRVAR